MVREFSIALTHAFDHSKTYYAWCYKCDANYGLASCSQLLAHALYTIYKPYVSTLPSDMQCCGHFSTKHPVSAYLVCLVCVQDNQGMYNYLQKWGGSKGKRTYTHTINNSAVVFYQVYEDKTGSSCKESHVAYVRHLLKK